MTPSRDRQILGILSAFSLTLLMLVFWRLSFTINRDEPSHLNLVAAVISGFNIAILFAWLGLGTGGGIAASVVSFVFVLWVDLRMGLYGYSVFTLPFFITIFFGYGLSALKAKNDRKYLLKSENLEEETNMISNDISRKRASILSLEEKLKRYSILKEAVEVLSAVLSIDDIIQLIVENASKTLGKAGRVMLYLVDVEKQGLVLSGSKGGEKVAAKKGDLFDQWVMRHRKSLIVEDVTRDFRFPTDGIETSKSVFRSLIATPLVTENKVTGILRMDSLREFAYTQDDLMLLDIIADLGAVAYQNAILYSKTQELAIKDSLTGLVVRRHFMERFGEELERAARKKGKLSLLILDIDHFKDYNDRYGHMSGDLVLKHLAHLISSMAHEGDVVARYGGEEIAILLCGRDGSRARNEAEEIRKLIKARPLVLRRVQTGFTASIGLASYPQDAISENELIRIADERLYKAKAGGRNRVCSE